ncbi:hypothetical protein PXC01_14265 [Maribacter sp. M208]|uniref:hypothetical protein n=1 Tax=Maribacter huludaoensis TaxID=3030010 RepID=UPI0023EB910C|nr:hypothetical protein [Maribacter huludaoensis]MDF4222764.1 hypothetical protein [Maribacter huludaoensis]
MKEIKGDTAYWYKRNVEFQKTLGLKKFEKSQDEFNFRFWNHGQVIEISKDSSEINGLIVNYIYHTKKANKSQSEALTNKVLLTSQQSENIYNILQNSKVLELPSDKNIENWTQGMDGITYIIEHSDKKSYWFKNYWTPSSQDSIPEAIVVLDLVKKLSDTLNLKEVYTSFKKSLPKKGCYNSGGMVNMCYISNSLELGYSGATKLPLGFYSSYSATYIGETKINGSASFRYNFDNNGFHHLNLQIAKWNIFHKNSSLSDYITYNYQNRILNINDAKNEFENHQFKYGLNLKKNLGIGFGLDYLSRNYDKIGGLLYASKWFSNPKISTTFSTSILNNQINYKAEIFKDINFNNTFLVNRISFGIAYEDFMEYKDLYFSFRVLL